MLLHDPSQWHLFEKRMENNTINKVVQQTVSRNYFLYKGLQIILAVKVKQITFDLYNSLAINRFATVENFQLYLSHLPKYHYCQLSQYRFEQLVLVLQQYPEEFEFQALMVEQAHLEKAAMY